jgi:hypothetical protein
MMQPDLRREAGLQVAARQDRVHLAPVAEVNAGNPPLVRL